VRQFESLRAFEYVVSTFQAIITCFTAGSWCRHSVHKWTRNLQA